MTRITADFLTGYDEGGVDEVHVVYTRFVSMVTQEPEVIRLLPLEVVEGEEPPAPDEVLPLYEFEPGAEQVLDALLPKYVTTRIFNALLQSAASELAARQRAMKSATDNAEELIKNATPGWPTRRARPRSPKRSARSSAAPPPSPDAK